MTLRIDFFALLESIVGDVYCLSFVSFFLSVLARKIFQSWLKLIMDLPKSMGSITKIMRLL